MTEEKKLKIIDPEFMPQQPKKKRKARTKAEITKIADEACQQVAKMIGNWKVFRITLMKHLRRLEERDYRAPDGSELLNDPDLLQIRHFCVGSPKFRINTKTPLPENGVRFVERSSRKPDGSWLHELECGHTITDQGGKIKGVGSGDQVICEKCLKEKEQTEQADADG